MSVGFALIIGLLIIAGLALLVPTETLVTSNATTPAGRALMRRFISRSRRFRLAGGLVGIGISLVITATRSGASGSITIGLLPALAGAVAGSIVAEAFRIRPVRGPRTASLGIRQDVDYSDATRRYARARPCRDRHWHRGGRSGARELGSGGSLRGFPRGSPPSAMGTAPSCSSWPTGSRTRPRPGR